MKTREDKIYSFFGHLIMTILTLLAIIPILLMFISSLTDNATLLQNGYSFLPEKWSTYAYEWVFTSSSSMVIKAYGMSFILTATGVVCSLALTTCLAYGLSKKGLPGRNVLTFLVFFTMLFNGGLVPTYINYTTVFHVKDTFFGLLVPSLMMSAFNVLLMKSYFVTGVPDEILEAAYIDGANEFQTMWKIAIPLSKPIITTVAMFSGIAYWNDWNNGYIYLTKRTDLYSIQNLLNRLMQNIQALTQNANNMAQAMASGVIPQITAVFGTCGGGMALIPAMTDFTFMESKNGKLFVNSPNALDGNHVSKCDTASADFQGEEAGLVDFAGTEEEILGQIRNLVSMLPANNEDEAYTECEDDLNRACADLANCAGDTGILLSQLSDNGIYFETKAAYGKDVVTAFIQLNGATVGAVANRSEIYGEDGTVKEKMDGTLSARGAKKAADFVNFCDAFCIPVLTITNVTGFKATKCSERTMAKNAAALTAAFANATVPKVNVVVGKAYGSAYVVMNSKSIGADMVFAWPNAEIGMMDAKSAAKIMYEGSDAATINEKAAEYATLQNNVTSAARRGYVDTIIEPEDTRKYVIGAFEMLYTKREDRPDRKHGTV